MLEKLNSTRSCPIGPQHGNIKHLFDLVSSVANRLETMQKKLVDQITAGFRILQEELDIAKERMRLATERLYQQEVDAEIERKQLYEYIHMRMDGVYIQPSTPSQAATQPARRVQALLDHLQSIRCKATWLACRRLGLRKTSG